MILKHAERSERELTVQVPALANPAFDPKDARRMLQEPSYDAPVHFGRYELIRRIGAGGMGEVFLAREGGGRARTCVLKKVLPSLQENRAFVGRFLDEARVVVRLNHPNIARVFQMGEEKGEYYLTMEYVQGKTVSRFTRRLRDRKAQLPLGLILLIGERVCQGLEYAHAAKDEHQQPLHLVHRDLSPANVCISYQGEVKIIDFGAAQSTLKEEQTAPRVVIGNLTYMAPEQAKKQPVDGRADVYSTGVMLWELLAWHALPQKGDPIERWRKAANPAWEAPSLFHGAIPPDVDAVVLKALKKDPKDRYQSALEFGMALKAARLKCAPDASEAMLGQLLARAFRKEKDGEDALLKALTGGQRFIDEQPELTRRLLVPPTALAFEHTATMGPAGWAMRGNQAVEDEHTDPERLRETLGVEDDSGTPTPSVDPRHHRAIQAVIGTPRAITAEQPLEAAGAGPVEITPVAERPGPPVDPSPVPGQRRPSGPGLIPLPTLNATRSSFGVTFHELTEPRIEPSFIQEIEASGVGESGEHDVFSPAQGEEVAGEIESPTGLDEAPPRSSVKFWALAVSVFFAAVGAGFLAFYLYWAQSQPAVLP